MKVSELKPDIALKELLDKKVEFPISSTRNKTVTIYADGEQPNDNLADEFIDIKHNGIISSRTTPYGLYSGNLALIIYCKTNTDNTIKRKRIEHIMASCEDLIHLKPQGDYFFKMSKDNLITPTTLNISSGYATTILNVEWRTNK